MTRGLARRLDRARPAYAAVYAETRTLARRAAAGNRFPELEELSKLVKQWDELIPLLPTKILVATVHDLKSRLTKMWFAVQVSEHPPPRVFLFGYRDSDTEYLQYAEDERQVVRDHQGWVEATPADYARWVLLGLREVRTMFLETEF